MYSSTVFCHLPPLPCPCHHTYTTTPLPSSPATKYCNHFNLTDLSVITCAQTCRRVVWYSCLLSSFCAIISNLLIIQKELGICIGVCSQYPWPASQNGCDVWMCVISQPFLTSWAVGPNYSALHQQAFQPCLCCATHEVVVICHMICIISQPALMSGTQSVAQRTRK